MYAPPSPFGDVRTPGIGSRPAWRYPSFVRGAVLRGLPDPAHRIAGAEVGDLGGVERADRRRRS
jgi:hypothetical protein